jgi:hypothetical protein
MARIHFVKAARQRYEQVPVIDPATGEQATSPMMKNGKQMTTKHGKPIVLRRTVEDRTQPKANLRCDSCGKDIEPGQSYKWVQPKSGPYGGRKRNRHADCPTWRPSELTSSNVKSILWSATEAFDDAIGGAETVQEIRDLVEEVATAAQDAIDALTESADNMEEGFGHETYQSTELRERAEEIEGWMDELSNWDADEDPDELDDLDIDADAIRAEVVAELGDDADEDDITSEVDTRIADLETEHEEAQSEFEAAIEQARESAQDLVGNCPE